ncbi:hypothetical protein PINS_up013599 [Pythium insidiosum]|nr:hypothetical protein PINS_up013599 [Pythium insidiosum]
MKALKEAADAQAQAEYAARRRQQEHEALVEREARNRDMELVRMYVEDELSAALRDIVRAEQRRQQQIEAEAAEWRRFEEQEAQRQREETMRRRAAQAEQYQQERARREQLQRLQAERRRRGKDAANATSAKPSTPKDLSVQDSGSALNHDNRATESDNQIAVTESQSTPPDNHISRDSQVSGKSTSNDTETASPVIEMPPQAQPLEDEAPRASEPVVTLTDVSSSTATTETATVAAESGNTDRSLSNATVIEPLSALLDQLPPFAEVLNVAAGSPAMDAGLQTGDLVIDFGGVTRTTRSVFSRWQSACSSISVNQSTSSSCVLPTAPPIHLLGCQR